MLALGLFADALFGFIAVINSAMESAELKGRRPSTVSRCWSRRARRGSATNASSSSRPTVVPGDVVRVEPGDQLVADGTVVDTRGLTVDESLLTGESDGVRKGPGDRLLSGSFAVSGSGHYELDAVREESYAEKIAGEAREFRHPPSPLQVEVNQILRATTSRSSRSRFIVLIGFSLRAHRSATPPRRRPRASSR